MGESVLISGFARVDGALACEGVTLARVAEEVGTPAYVYSAAMVRDRYRRARCRARSRCRTGSTTRSRPTPIARLLRVLKELGAGVDVVSGGELYRALRAGFAGQDILFGGVGKTEGELRDALTASVRMINVESVAEIRLIDAIARELGVNAPIGIGSIRKSPWTARIATSRRASAEQSSAFRSMKCAPPLAWRPIWRIPRLIGLDMHIGSQLFKLDPYMRRHGKARGAAGADSRRRNRHDPVPRHRRRTRRELRRRAVARPRAICQCAGEARETYGAHAAHGAGPVHRRQLRHAAHARAVPEAQWWYAIS